jgi:hypothetical protein
MFRQSYNNFIEKLHKGQIVASDLYSGRAEWEYLQDVSRFSSLVLDLAFYLTLLGMIWIAKTLVL